ncbi:hypothetical protein [Mycolicibacterium arenosum]|uniref:Uncharacterized protein n=1 Tax=Mycolicibacterium arenosum TaxID=2952157 RepID=A0ABT1M6D3_9MYCO|nr:hypothetical protein [Mycolicibacterium sp. CAU 1645]MCP9273372.1 hypothetical protein [Mycolicibacterium sp. CAU 1645]
MPIASASRDADESPIEVDVDVAAQCPVIVYNCSRLGRTANPPRRSLSDLFRFGRWR